MIKNPTAHVLIANIIAKLESPHDEQYQNPKLGCAIPPPIIFIPNPNILYIQGQPSMKHWYLSCRSACSAIPRHMLGNIQRQA